MKMKIVNYTQLKYSIIGDIIDKIINNKDNEETHYIGQIEWVIVEVKNKYYVVQIRYLKRYVEWIFSDKVMSDEED